MILLHPLPWPKLNHFNNKGYNNQKRTQLDKFVHNGKFLILVLLWILSACAGHKIDGYLGDITGAFDRICKEYLLAKFCNAGVGPLYLNFLGASGGKG